MTRVLVAAIVLLGAVYFYLDQGRDTGRPPETRQQALDKAKAVEQIAQDRVNELNDRLEEQEQAARDDDDDQT